MFHRGRSSGRFFFLLYTADVLRLIERHNLHPHGYADYTQVYGFRSPSSCLELRELMSACLDEVWLWMQSYRLQLNTSRTEVLWCATSRREDQIPTDPIRVGKDLICSATFVRDLGIYLDSDASMRTYVSKTVSNCFAALRQMRSIRQCVSRQVMLSMVCLLYTSPSPRDS